MINLLVIKDNLLGGRKILCLTQGKIVSAYHEDMCFVELPCFSLGADTTSWGSRHGQAGVTLLGSILGTVRSLLAVYTV